MITGDHQITAKAVAKNWFVDEGGLVVTAPNLII